MRQAEKESSEQRQNDVRKWIEAATKETFPSDNFFQSVRSGVLLCKYHSFQMTFFSPCTQLRLIARRLLNTISPGVIKEVHVAYMPFYQMENIGYFVQACRKLGVKTIFE